MVTERHGEFLRISDFEIDELCVARVMFAESDDPDFGPESSVVTYLNNAIKSMLEGRECSPAMLVAREANFVISSLERYKTDPMWGELAECMLDKLPDFHHAQAA